LHLSSSPFFRVQLKFAFRIRSLIVLFFGLLLLFGLFSVGPPGNFSADDLAFKHCNPVNYLLLLQDPHPISNPQLSSISASKFVSGVLEPLVKPCRMFLRKLILLQPIYTHYTNSMFTSWYTKNTLKASVHFQLL